MENDRLPVPKSELSGRKLAVSVLKFALAELFLSVRFSTRALFFGTGWSVFRPSYANIGTSWTITPEYNRVLVVTRGIHLISISTFAPVPT